MDPKSKAAQIVEESSHGRMQSANTLTTQVTPQGNGGSRPRQNGPGGSPSGPQGGPGGPSQPKNRHFVSSVKEITI